MGTYVELQNVSLNIPRIDGPLGFQARAFFNSSNNELVIAFTGTEGFDEADLPELVPDLIADLGLAVAGVSPQDATAQLFIQQAIAAARAEVGVFGSFDVTYVGHSLGGFLAQTASASGPEGEVVVFNAPGAGGFLGLPENHPFPEDNFTYIYSDPSEWGLLGGAIHSVGTPLSDNIFYIAGSEGHALNTSDGTGLGDLLTDSSTLVSAGDDIFLPIDEALQILGATQLLDFFDDGGNEPASNGIVAGTSGADMINDTYTDAQGDMISEGNDVIEAGAGDDVISGSLGADTLNGGEGVDSADYSDSNERIYVDLRDAAIRSTDWGASGDVLISIENIIGSDFNDYLYGNNSSNMLDGGAGNDLLRGHNTADTLIGGSGNDNLIGHGGNDVLIGGLGADTLNGSSGVDTADYSSSSERVYINLRDDAVNQSNWGAAGDVLTSIENITGSGFDDYIYGDNGNNRIEGGAGDDRLRGHGGSDTLIGGAGDDDMYGNNGADVFIFAPNEGNDTITNFTDGVDLLQMDDISFDDLTISSSGSGTLIAWTTGSVEIVGTPSTEITQDDFIL